MDTMKLREALEDLERRMDSIGHNVELRNTGVAPHLVDKWALELAALAKSLAPPPVTNAAPPDSLERLCHQCGTLHVIPEGAECLKAAPEVQQNILQIAMRAGITVEWVRENYIPIKRIVIAAPLLPPTVNSALIGTDDREHFRVTAGCYCGWSIINDFEWEQHLKRITPAAAPALSEETPTELSREQIKEAYRILIRFTENGYDPIRFARWLATQPPAAREPNHEEYEKRLNDFLNSGLVAMCAPQEEVLAELLRAALNAKVAAPPVFDSADLLTATTGGDLRNAIIKNLAAQHLHVDPREMGIIIATVLERAATPSEPPECEAMYGFYSCSLRKGHARGWHVAQGLNEDALFCWPISEDAKAPPHWPKCDTPLPDVEYRAEGQPARTWAGETPSERLAEEAELLVGAVRDFEKHSYISGDPIGGCGECLKLFDRLAAQANSVERALATPPAPAPAGETRRLVCSKCGYFYESAFLHADEPKVCPNDGTALATPSSAASEQK